MSKRNVYYKVHNEAIRSFMYKGQPVDRLMNRVLDDARDNGKKLAPVRTGRLRDSISVGRRPRIDGAWGITGAVYVKIGYGLYVEEGTTGPIRPKYANFLTVPNRHKGGYFLAESVEGQDAQNFLKKGLSAALTAEPRLDVRMSSGGFG